MIQNKSRFSLFTLHIENTYLIEIHDILIMLLLNLRMNRVGSDLTLLKLSTSDSKLLAAVGTMFTDTVESLTIILTT